MHGNFLRCHARIVQPATEPHPLSAAVCRRPQVHRDAFNGALQQQRPLLANRASPKRPTDQSISSINAVIPLVNRTTRNQTRFLHGKKNCVHALASTPCGDAITGAPYDNVNGASETITADLVVDASGRGTLIDLLRSLR